MDDCTAKILAFNQHIDKITDGMKDHQNLKFLNARKRDVQDRVKEFLAKMKYVFDDISYRNDSREALKGVIDEMTKLGVAYTAFKWDLKAYYEEAEENAQQESAKWDSARRDDSTLYKNATKNLQRSMDAYMEHVRKGSEVISELSRANNQWEIANKAGSKKEIEEAYKGYHQAHSHVLYWQKRMTELNNAFESVTRSTGVGWEKFISETKESFRLYSDEVAVANARYHEFGYHIYGKY